MKIIIAGNGNVGETLARQLSAEGHDLVLIDEDPKVLESSMERYDIMTIQGNCAALHTLNDAGVKKADLLIACTGNDELNLLCCMTAHTVNNGIHTIARLRDPDYTVQAYTMRNAFGLSMIFNPEKQAAEEIVRLLKYPGFLKRDSFVKGRVEIVELKIDEGSPLRDVALSRLPAVLDCHILVCAVLRDGQAVAAPKGDFVLTTDDRIFVTAPQDTLAGMLKTVGIVTHRNRNVFVIGGGTNSYYLAEKLQKSRMELTMIEQDPERCERLASQFPNVKVIEGDARDYNLLKSEGISDADALVTLTNSDELNMLLSLYGDRMGVPQIITKLSTAEDTGITDALPIGSIVSPRNICCNNILRYVRAMKSMGAAITMHSIADGQVETLEFEIDDETDHCGVALKELKIKPNILIACINRGENIEIPSGDSSYDVGDRVVVVAGGEDPILCFNDIFE